MAVGLTDKLMHMADIVRMIDACESGEIARDGMQRYRDQAEECRANASGIVTAIEPAVLLNTTPQQTVHGGAARFGDGDSGTCAILRLPPDGSAYGVLFCTDSP